MTADARRPARVASGTRASAFRPTSSRAHLRGVRPGRRLDHAPVRRHRPGARHLPAAGRADGRAHLGRERARRAAARSTSPCVSRRGGGPVARPVPAPLDALAGAAACWPSTTMPPIAGCSRRCSTAGASRPRSWRAGAAALAALERARGRGTAVPSGAPRRPHARARRLRGRRARSAASRRSPA